MLLISNIGNRDVKYQGQPIDGSLIRQNGEDLLKNYATKKKYLSYPLISPFLEKFGNKIKNIYLFVTNQGDERFKNSDTLHFGRIIKQWTEETYNINVNVIEYRYNPTNYELIYNFFTTYFSEYKNLFDDKGKRIISLSGGTPQMNGALYVILSSIYPTNNEFYNIFEEKLIPINHEQTINKIFIKKSCTELLKINEYQSIIEVLNKYNIMNHEPLLLFLNYAHFRKNFDFKQSEEYLKKFLNSIPSSEHEEYTFLNLENISDPKTLIKELFWNMEMSCTNQNYLFLVALLFRVEEALLFEINNYFFNEIIPEGFKKKKSKSILLKHLENEELDLWNSLKEIKIKGKPLKLDDLTRPVLFFIAKLKSEKLEKKTYVFKIDNILEILDRINKYYYDNEKEDENKERYGHPTSTICLGDLRNSSLIAHGFESISRQKIDDLYKGGLDDLMSNLKTHIQNLLGFLIGNKRYPIDNVFDKLNQKILSLILKI